MDGNEPLIAGLLLAVGSVLAGSAAALLKQRGAVAAPAVVPDIRSRGIRG